MNEDLDDGPDDTPLGRAHLRLDANQLPHSPRFNDRYSSPAGALAQARAVFLAGNELPTRWQGRECFVVLETGFGLGNNFLATWAAWKADPQRAKRLYFLSLERYPLQAAELAQAHCQNPAGSELEDLARQLIAAWPPLAPGLHRLDFEGGALTLLLALGDVAETLPGFRAEVDAFFLDGFAPDRNPAMWDARTLKTLARLAAPQATAATWSVARATREALVRAGFVVEKRPGFAHKAQQLQARFAPVHTPPRPAAHGALAPGARRALVLGAGLAGAACAQALRQAGLAVTVIDQAAQPAQGASGNPGGLFHGSVHADDGPHARWNRAAALRCQQWLRRHPPPWQLHGLLRGAAGEQPEKMAALLARQALPPDYLSALDGPSAQAQLGLPWAHPAWHYPGGGALPPPDWVRTLLQGSELRLNTPVAALRQAGPGWQLLDAEGSVIDETELLVLANGPGLPGLLAPLSDQGALLAQALRPQRGQLALLPAGHAGPRPRLPIAAGGYLVPLPDGRLVAGATSQFDDPDPSLRSDDHTHNLGVWQRLCGDVQPPAERQGRVSWRLLADDKLPLVGGLPSGAPRYQATQAAHWPRLPGLVICAALASRGITWAALAAELATAQALGLPAPVENRLIDAVDPARFAVRRVRRAG
ncbi:tRNA 5-methylaminomethyl-2-thiouridine biosynthesis bifunctional protein [Inhella inkyongensis]|uniref:tRNA 5-methylaminomethyl-2-thiouridine biosynthesis bifunctional protein MnmC n=1 Tax=Inhella inkyongensis TaxID=392593 RepID=A0A840SDR6_9BURK|nr:FAD-dependent 5-carboxymethylaminomethyl-2-thiouridine(34) oxidoreductase MnmC [Inhella inkyongensis]MBB5206429.1 tRNA 5-methylaminomethyl-2-thiouridine biosynthesis bifunctional protein [Inhella inkyongensis]